jgi:hypothetical protein
MLIFLSYFVFQYFFKTYLVTFMFLIDTSLCTYLWVQHGIGYTMQCLMIESDLGN